MTTSAPPARNNRAALVVAIIGAIVGGWFLYDVVRTGAETDPWSVGVLLAAACGTAAGFWYWQDWRDRKARGSGDYSHDPDRSWVAPVAIVGVLAVLGFIGGLSTRDGYIRLYCLYGSVSAAQLDGCMGHVNSDEINGRDTQAARFARGETSECLNDAGPYCADASKWNAIEEPE